MERDRSLTSTALGFALGGLAFAAATFTVSDATPDRMIEPKWYAAGAAAIVGLFTLAAVRLACPKALRFGSLWRGSEAACIAVCTTQAALFFMQKAGLAESYGRFTAGSFDNVAGLASCLAINLPMGAEWMRSGKPWRRITVAACKAVCIAAIAASGSRPGLLCVAAWALAEMPWRPKAKVAAAAGVAALGIVLAVGIKTDSSRGRWFIAARTCELIAAKPAFGHGPGGFAANYMDVQADWLASHPGSPYATLADNIGHPLCEWLAVAADYGLAGVAAIAALALAAVAYARRHLTAESRTGVRALACVGVFSLLSYPLLYPSTWLSLGMAAAAIGRDILSRHARSVSVALVAAMPFCGIALARRATLATELRDVQDKAALGLSERMMPRYASLYKELEADRRFLYNYAAGQYEAGRYAEALRTARECGTMLADYNLCLLEGDIQRALRNHGDAMACYRRAHRMCPSRFVPLYEMFGTALERGDTATARKLGCDILAKPIKVRSRETLEIVAEVRRRLRNGF